MLTRAAMEAVCAAMVGGDNDVCREWGGVDPKTGAPLSDGQISYRVTIAKTIAGFDKGDGFRRAWRQGRSPFMPAVRRAVLPAVRAEYAQITAQIEHPKPKTISTERFERRWRGKAARYEQQNARAA